MNQARSFIIALVLSCTIFVEFPASASNGGRGGGDTVASQPVTLARIQSAVYEAAPFVRAWLQGVEGQLTPDLGISGWPRRELPLPVGVEKIYQSGIYRRLNELKIVYRTSAPCSSDRSSEKDGSVVSVTENRICISGFLLSHKLNEVDYTVQTQALILHELTHLAGASESEAISIQTQYLSDMRAVPAELIQKLVRQKGKLFYSVAFKISRLQQDLADADKLCSTILELRSEFDRGAADSTVSAISVYQASTRDKVDQMSVIIGQAWQLFVCGQDLKRPDLHWVQDYNNGFGGKSRVKVSQWLKSRGISNDIHDVGWAIFVDKRGKISELDSDFQSYASMLKDIAFEIPFSFAIRPEVLVDETSTAK